MGRLSGGEHGLSDEFDARSDTSPSRLINTEVKNKGDSVSMSFSVNNDSVSRCSRTKSRYA